MRNCTHFNAKLRELMEENHLSVRKLADLSGLSPSTIQRLRSQPDVPHMDTIEALADAFCIDPKVLILADAEDARELDWAAEDAMRAQEGNKASIMYGGHSITITRAWLPTPPTLGPIPAPRKYTQEISFSLTTSQAATFSLRFTHQ